MKLPVISNRVIGAAGLGILALALVPGLFLAQGSDPDEGPLTGDGEGCLPGNDEAGFTRSQIKQDKPVPDAAVERKAGPREQAPLSRGERDRTVVRGTASWYGGGDNLDGSLTASGEIFNAADFTAAHRTISFGTMVRVTYLRNGKSVVVRINDRGPFTGGRIIDLSRAAAAEIGLLPHGTGTVELEILDR